MYAHHCDAYSNPGTRMLTVTRLKKGCSPDSQVIVKVVRVWREARAQHLAFLTELHDADEDCNYLSRVVLPANEVWVAEVDQVVSGFIAFEKGWINQLYVAPRFQRRAIGTELLNIAKRDNTSLQLWAFAVNHPAIRFYQRLGFRAMERSNGSCNEAKQPDVRMRWDAPFGALDPVANADQG